MPWIQILLYQARN